MRLAPCGLVYPAGITAAVDPAAARGRAVVFQVGELCHWRAAAGVEAVDLPEYGLGPRLFGRAFNRIIPGEVVDRTVLRIRRSRVHRAQSPSEMPDEVQFTSAVTRRLHCLRMPLKQTL